MKETQEIKSLLSRYINGECTDRERALLETWYNNDHPRVLADLSEHEINQDLQLVFDRLPTTTNKVVLLWKKIAVAAVLLVTTSIGIWLYQHSSIKSDIPVKYTKDILPGGQGATLTLADGRKIRLGSAKNGELANEAGVRIAKTGKGQLVYEAHPTELGANRINTLSTAKGETYFVTLPDGSKVWLNSASSITYSATLINNGQRRVKLEGEAYFEVSKDPRNPFLVENRGQLVKVLGTRFNINSYVDEAYIKTTLAEGSIEVSLPGVDASSPKRLKPGQQSLVSTYNRSGMQIREVDPAAAVDWRNAEFVFENEQIQSIMRKLARWYDVEVIYETLPEHNDFSGVMSRSETIVQLLRKIALTNKVKFEIDGRRVKVMR